MTCPELQFHGSVDSIVPLSIAQQLHEVTPARSKCGVAKKFVLFHGTGHNDVLDRNGQEMQDAIQTWIQQVEISESRR